MSDNDAPQFADCAHGSDDRLSCFGCTFGEPIGPHLPRRGPWRVRYSAEFVQQARSLGAPRFPLRIASEGVRRG